MTNRNKAVLRWAVFLLALAGLALVFFTMVADMTPRRKLTRIEGYTAWPREVVEIAETIPVQDGGRVKPLATQAGFMMLRLHGARAMKIAAPDATRGGEQKLRLGPTEWMLDCLFRPRLAMQLPTFRVENSDVLVAAGIEVKDKRDRYSYAQIESGRDRLIELAREYDRVDEKKRGAVQRQMIALAQNVWSF
jgi:hypothetical protein